LTVRSCLQNGSRPCVLTFRSAWSQRV